MLTLTRWTLRALLLLFVGVIALKAQSFIAESTGKTPDQRGLGLYANQPHVQFGIENEQHAMVLQKDVPVAELSEMPSIDAI